LRKIGALKDEPADVPTQSTKKRRARPQAN
jgi:hypothetical protein